LRKSGDCVTRRAFIGTAAGIAGAALVGKRAFAEETAAKPASTSGGYLAKVAAAHCETVFSGNDLDAEKVSRMLDAAVSALKDSESPSVWKSLFSADDVVGIKLNCISRTAKPNKALIDAIVANLKSAGVKDSNIIVWDRFEDQLARRARLKLNRSADGVRIYGTERQGDATGGYDETVFYETENDTPEYRSSTGAKSLVSKIVTTDCTKIINMPVLKDHNQAGITACLKNLSFGAVNNTARFHKAPMYCSPAVADIMLIPCIRQKTVLHIVDGLRVCYNGGPDASNSAYIQNHSTIYVATDPVACDTIALEVVVKMRADEGLPDLFETSGHPVHIADAAAKGLGVGDRAKIELALRET
jgi:hypothetical protein